MSVIVLLAAFAAAFVGPIVAATFAYYRAPRSSPWWGYGGLLAQLVVVIYTMVDASRIPSNGGCPASTIEDRHRLFVEWFIAGALGVVAAFLAGSGRSNDRVRGGRAALITIGILILMFMTAAAIGGPLFCDTS